MYTVQEVLDFVKEEDVKFIRLAFFDLLGKQKNISIMPYELENTFKNGFLFDASCVYGFEGPENSDLFLHPDPSTLAVLPWRPLTGGKVVRMFCEIKYADGTPYKKDCRYILNQAVKTAKELCKIDFKFGSEIEFYLFKLDENGEPTKIPFDNAGYLDIAPEDKGENIRRDICFTLENMGITPEASHHEEGPGQNEIDFRANNPLEAADENETFKWIVRTKANSSGLFADFSPKPFENKPGSGMHITISSSRPELTPKIIAGIMKHIPEITIFLNPTENSYRRIGEAKAPKYISYGKNNRSVFIRTPSNSGKNENQKIEVRSADPECNPYLAYAALIYAAIEGIQNDYPQVQEVTQNLFELESHQEDKFEKLPDSFDQAYNLAFHSEFVHKYFGKEIVPVFAKQNGICF